MTDSCVVACLQQATELVSPTVTNGLMALAGSLGGGSIIGFTAGYFLKKMVKITAFIMGAFALVLMYLGYTGMFSVNWNKTEETVRVAAQAAIEETAKVVEHTANDFNNGTGWMGNDLLIGGAVLSFVPSFLIGLKKG